MRTMKDFKYIWIIGLIVTFLIVAVPIVSFVSAEPESEDNPWAFIPAKVPSTNHSDIIKGPFDSGSDVTRACLECHEDAGHEVLQTVHWKWEGDPVMMEGRDEPVTIGKKKPDQ